MQNHKKSLKLFCRVVLVLFTIVITSGLRAGEADFLNKWKEFSLSRDSVKLIDWLGKKARGEITGNYYREKLKVDMPPFYGRNGIFITLKKKNGVRGCYGSFYPASSNIERVLSDYIEGALTRDPRHEPLEISELNETDIIVTIATHPYPVRDIYSVDLSENGILIKISGSSVIYVPEEIKSIDYILKKLKNADCEFYAFRAVTIKAQYLKNRGK